MNIMHYLALAQYLLSGVKESCPLTQVSSFDSSVSTSSEAPTVVKISMNACQIRMINLLAEP